MNMWFVAYTVGFFVTLYLCHLAIEMDVVLRAEHEKDFYYHVAAAILLALFWPLLCAAYGVHCWKTRRSK